MTQRIVVFTRAGSNRLLDKPSQEQPLWPEHRDFMNDLDDRGLIYIAGPWVDGSGAMVVMNVDSPEAAMEIMRDDPWAIHDNLVPDRAMAWNVMMNSLEP